MIGYKILNTLKIKEVEYNKTKNTSHYENELYTIVGESKYNLYILDSEDGTLYSNSEKAKREVATRCYKRIINAEAEIIKYNNILKQTNK